MGTAPARAIPAPRQRGSQGTSLRGPENGQGTHPSLGSWGQPRTHGGEHPKDGLLPFSRSCRTPIPTNPGGKSDGQNPEPRERAVRRRAGLRLQSQCTASLSLLAGSLPHPCRGQWDLHRVSPFFFPRRGPQHNFFSTEANHCISPSEKQTAF